MPFKNVLLVYDGSDESKEVLQMVCRFARPDKARVTVLTLRILPLTKGLPTYERGADPETDAMVDEAERLVRRCGLQAATSVRYARALGPTVVAEARLHAADLLALAVPDIEQHTEEHAWHADLGAILRQTSCALMLLRPGRT